MKRWKICCGSLALLAGLSSAAQAQLPAGPAAAGPAVGGITAPAAAPAAPSNLWSFICPTPDQKAACKAKICNSAIGQMLNNGLTPLSTMSGGLVPMCCPAVNPADLLKPADSPEGAAARMKKDELEAKARREAVRQLGLRDCHYWPEAQDALINALRADRNECVRLEAAWALNNGCCCNKATIKALMICVSGSQEDGNPSESSPRVREAAQAALAHCLSCYTEVIPVPPDIKRNTEPPPPIKGEKPPTSVPIPDKLPPLGQASATPADYYHHIEAVSQQQLVEDGKHLLERGMPTPAPVPTVEASTAPHSVSDIFRNAFSTPSTTPMVSPPTMIEKTAPPPVVVPAAVPNPLAPISKVAPMMTPAPMQQTSFTVPASSKPGSPYQAQTGMANSTTAKEKTLAVPATLSAAQYPTNTTQVIALLKNASQVEERVWAAHLLASCDGWTNSDATAALIKTARTDADGSVRAACVQSLGRMNVSTLPVVTAVQELKSDRDPQVRAEADLALRQFGEAGPLQLR